MPRADVDGTFVSPLNSSTEYFTHLGPQLQKHTGFKKKTKKTAGSMLCGDNVPPMRDYCHFLHARHRHHTK